MGKRIEWKNTPGGLFYPEEMAVQQKAAFREQHRAADGILAIYEYPADDDGDPIREKGRCLLCEPNLVVNSGRAALRKLNADTASGGGASGTYDLGYLAVGNGSGGGAVTPLPTDGALASELTNTTAAPRPLLTLTVPPPGPPFMTNLWTGQIGATELNGESIDEAGLFCLDGATLYAYRTFAAQAKSAGFILELRWSCIF